MASDRRTLQEWVSEAAERLAVPGVAVGVYHAGEEHYAFHGVTSLENPLPVDEHTLFQFGSTGKTFTATAIMRLVDQGRVELDATVRTYLPELALKDEERGPAGHRPAAAQPHRRVVGRRVRQHRRRRRRAGPLRRGDGRRRAGHAARAPRCPTTTPRCRSPGGSSKGSPARRTSRRSAQLLFEPLGLDHCFFFPNEIMTRRFVVGHNQHADGSITVTRPWALARSASPAGGISSNAGDLIAWARFHLGDGRAADGTEVLPEKLLAQMKEATVETPGSALGDAIGISWMLRDVDGVRMVGHGGDTLGQHSTFDMVPERQFAITGLTNCGPNGNQFLDELGRWALEAYLGVVDRDPEPVALDDEQLADYAGTYETVAATARITLDGQRWSGPQGGDQAGDAGQAGGGGRGATRRRAAVPARHPARTRRPLHRHRRSRPRG